VRIQVLALYHEENKYFASLLIFLCPSYPQHLRSIMHPKVHKMQREVAVENIETNNFCCCSLSIIQVNNETDPK